MAAWQHIRAVRDPDRFEAWLHRLLVHACYREAAAPPATGERRGPRAGHRVARRRCQRADLADRDQLERGFRRLDTGSAGRARRCIYYLGLSLDETAEVLGVPPGTVRSRLHRATSAMRAALEADARSSLLNEGRPA